MTAFWISSKDVLQVMTKRKSFIVTAAIFVSIGTIFGGYRFVTNYVKCVLNEILQYKTYKQLYLRFEITVGYFFIIKWQIKNICSRTLYMKIINDDWWVSLVWT